jgi:GNAT superfamily N-acetyltransferase
MLVIREAVADDVPLIAQMIREFAEYSRELDQVSATEEGLRRDGFGASPRFHSLMAAWDGALAGYAVYLFSYSTWAGQASLFVEDLFVRERFRGQGTGTALLRRMALIAHESGCFGMWWEVLNWNSAAIEFYRSSAAILDQNRFPLLLSGAEFEKFALAK